MTEDELAIIKAQAIEEFLAKAESEGLFRTLAQDAVKAYQSATYERQKELRKARKSADYQTYREQKIEEREWERWMITNDSDYAERYYARRAETNRKVRERRDTDPEYDARMRDAERSYDRKRRTDPLRREKQRGYALDYRLRNREELNRRQRERERQERANRGPQPYPDHVKKLDFDTRKVIRSRFAGGERLSHLAREYGVSSATIRYHINKVEKETQND